MQRKNALKRQDRSGGDATSDHEDCIYTVSSSAVPMRSSAASATATLYHSLRRFVLMLSLLVCCCCCRGVVTAAMASSEVSSAAALLRQQQQQQQLVSECACGSSRVSVTLPSTTTKGSTPLQAVDCHCAQCRKYHVASFASYLVVDDDDNDDDKSRSIVVFEGDTRTFSDSCGELGAVQRIACSSCHSKLATTTTQSSDDSRSSKMLINMGPLVDATIPAEWASSWRSQRSAWQRSQEATWLHAQPAFEEDEDEPAAHMVTGGCACGRHRYRIRYQPPQELQHCYCRLCRQMSGASFMTWIPVYNADFEWIQGDTNNGEASTISSTATTTTIAMGEPALVRTTDHGQRHVCQACGGALTIVYDDQEDMTWPAAGGLNDNEQANMLLLKDCDTVSQTLCNVMHICCRYRQAWYQLPKDGLPRVQEAC